MQSVSKNSKVVMLIAIGRADREISKTCKFVQTLKIPDKNEIDYRFHFYRGFLLSANYLSFLFVIFWKLDKIRMQVIIYSQIALKKFRSIPGLLKRNLFKSS